MRPKNAGMVGELLKTAICGKRLDFYNLDFFVNTRCARN